MGSGQPICAWGLVGLGCKFVLELKFDATAVGFAKLLLSFRIRP